MEREGLRQEGDTVTIVEGVALEQRYYYTIHPSLAIERRLSVQAGTAQLSQRGKRVEFYRARMERLSRKGRFRRGIRDQGGGT